MKKLFKKGKAVFLSVVISVGLSLFAPGYGAEEVDMGKNVLTFTAFGDSILYVTKDNSLAIRGRVYLAYDDYYDYEEFTIIENSTDIYALSKSVSAARSFNQYIIKTDGSVWKMELQKQGDTVGFVFVKVSGLKNCLKVSVGYHHAMALLADGSVWAWGENEFGQLGDGTNDRHSAPVKVKGLSNIIDMDAGGAHGIALSANGAVYTWGDNSYGQLGDGTFTGYHGFNEETHEQDCYENHNSSIPQKVAGLDRVTQVSAEMSLSVALIEDGTVWEWGVESFSYDFPWNNTLRPKKVENLNNIITLSSGNHISLALDENGVAWKWGWLCAGYVLDDAGIRSLPSRVPDVSEIDLIASGNNDFTVLGTDGAVWIWEPDFDLPKDLGFSSAFHEKMVCIATKEELHGKEVLIGQPYTYFPSDWAQGEVERSVSVNLVPRDLQTCYQFKITRQELCALAIRLLEEKSDMPAEEYIEKNGYELETDLYTDTKDLNILIASSLGIVTGKGGGIFDPEGYITRQETAVILYRLAKTLGYNMSAIREAGFVDDGSISSWAKDAVSYVATTESAESGKTVMAGIGNNTFDPQGNCTREMAYIIVARLYFAG